MWLPDPELRTPDEDPIKPPQLSVAPPWTRQQEAPFHKGIIELSLEFCLWSSCVPHLSNEQKQWCFSEQFPQQTRQIKCIEIAKRNSWVIGCDLAWFSWLALSCDDASLHIIQYHQSLNRITPKYLLQRYIPKMVHPFFSSPNKTCSNVTRNFDSWTPEWHSRCCARVLLKTFDMPPSVRSHPVSETMETGMSRRSQHQRVWVLLI